MKTSLFGRTIPSSEGWTTPSVTVRRGKGTRQTMEMRSKLDPKLTLKTLALTSLRRWLAKRCCTTLAKGTRAQLTAAHAKKSRPASRSFVLSQRPKAKSKLI